MKNIFSNIQELTKDNTNFRKVIRTGSKSQLVLMCIRPSEDIGDEIHENTDQILFIVGGKADAVLNGTTTPVAKGDAIFVQAGTRHNFINTGSGNLQLYTIYAPSEHKDGTIQKTKKDKE